MGKIKENRSRDSMTTPIREQSVIESQALDIFIFYLHTKFGNCRFSRSGDMTVGVKMEKMGHVALTMPL